MNMIFKILLIMTFAGSAFAIKEFDREAFRQPITNEIYPFTTDGCTRFVDHQPWVICCERHDVAYWAGVGGEKGRWQADATLFECLSRKANPFLASLVWLAVRASAVQNTSRLFPAEYRWGYGWPFALGTHRPLNSLQKESIRSQLSTVFPAVEQWRKQKNLPQLNEDERGELAERVKSIFWDINNLED